jgi:hypothetical protein
MGQGNEENLQKKLVIILPTIIIGARGEVSADCAEYAAYSGDIRTGAVFMI